MAATAAAMQAAVAKLEVLGSPPQHLALVAEAALAAWGADLAAAEAAAAAAGTRAAAPVPLGASHLLTGLRGVVDAPERALVRGGGGAGRVGAARARVLALEGIQQRKGGSRRTASGVARALCSLVGGFHDAGIVPMPTTVLPALLLLLLLLE